MNQYIDEKKEDFASIINHYKEELKHVRTGQANPELIDGIVVTSYETAMPLKQVATITVPDPKTIMVQPWDKSLLKDIEKAIISANLGFSPLNDGNVIRVPMPPLTEENRKELVKIINQKAEKSRISIRQLRDKVKESIVKAHQDNEVNEDDKFRYLKELDEFTSEQTKEINEITKNKEELLLQV